MRGQYQVQMNVSGQDDPRIRGDSGYVVLRIKIIYNDGLGVSYVSVCTWVSVDRLGMLLW